MKRNLRKSLEQAYSDAMRPYRWAAIQIRKGFINFPYHILPPIMAGAYRLLRHAFVAGAIIGVIALSTILVGLAAWKVLDPGTKAICLFELRQLADDRGYPEGGRLLDIPWFAAENGWWDEARPFVECAVGSRWWRYPATHGSPDDRGKEES